MTVAPEFDTARCAKFIQSVTPVAKRIAQHRATPHPMLGKQDLMGRALEVCLQVWQRYHATSSDDDVLRIAVSAMDRRLRNEYRGTLAFGEAEVQIVSLTANKGNPRTDASRPVHKTIEDALPSVDPTPDEWNLDPRPLVPEERYRPLLKTRLGKDAQTALRELLEPSGAAWDRYVQIVVGEWTSEGHPVRSVQRRGVTEALVAGLGWDRTRASRAWTRLSRMTRDGVQMTAKKGRMT